MIVLVTAGVTLVALLLELEGGDLVVVRGGLAPSVLSDMRDVVRRERIKSGRLRVMRVKDHARLEASAGLSQKQVQVLRNVIGQVPLSKLLAGAKAQGPKRKKRRA